MSRAGTPCLSTYTGSVCITAQRLASFRPRTLTGMAAPVGRQLLPLWLTCRPRL